MTDARAIAGTYADLKFIKTRSMAQIVVEIPIEQADAFLEMFGAPQPGKEIPVAIARMNVKPDATPAGAVVAKASGATAGETAPKSKTAFKDMPLPQQAGIRATNDDNFYNFLIERHRDLFERADRNAAQVIRSYCNVNSRRELSTNHDAANKWRELESQYQAWLTDQAYADTRR